MSPRQRKPLDGAQLDAALTAWFPTARSMRERSILFAEIISCGDRTVRKWINGELAVPVHIAMLVNLMIDHDVQPQQLRP